MRPLAVKKLLDSVVNQTIPPNQIIIVDGSTNMETKEILKNNSTIDYYLVSQEHRGLTKQRNFGVSKTNETTDIVAFLDDDLILEPNYFEEIIKTYQQYTEVIGVGGIDLKENTYFKKKESKIYSKLDYFEFDSWVSKESLRNKIRKIFGLISNLQPDLIPECGHGRSGLPPNGKTYQVEHFMGGIASYKKELFDKISFSKYFEGYGLYEDFDFCVRSLKYGKLYVNTNAHVWHYHDPAGRPNQNKYGKMVVRNGWYVWRLAHPKPSIKNKMKWHVTTLLLMFLRFFNVFTTTKRKEAFTESLGRFVAWIHLFFNKPKIEL